MRHSNLTLTTPTAAEKKKGSFGTQCAGCYVAQSRPDPCTHKTHQACAHLNYNVAQYRRKKKKKNINYKQDIQGLLSIPGPSRNEFMGHSHAYHVELAESSTREHMHDYRPTQAKLATCFIMF